MLKVAIILNILFISSIIYMFYPQKEVDKQLEPYVNELTSLIKEKCGDNYNKPIKQIIRLKSLPHYIVGECTPNKYNMEIDIDPLFWFMSTEGERFSVIGHELTHCYLYGIHINDMHNYMNEMLPTLTKEEFFKQFNEVLNVKCKR